MPSSPQAASSLPPALRSAAAAARSPRGGRRQLVLRAALRCFEREGFHRTSMATVIEEAGVSAGTVYRYFPSKTDLIRACADEVSVSVAEVVEGFRGRETPPGPQEVVGRLLEAAFDVGRRYDVDLTRIVVSIWAEALRDPPLLESVRELYLDLRTAMADLARTWIAQAPPASASELPVDPDLVAQALFGAVPGYIVQHLLLGGMDVASYTRGLADLARFADPR
ncbi:TetR/AcrR family transcriptional regulator [Dermatophilaceae bacterium Soc4.6]